MVAQQSLLSLSDADERRAERLHDRSIVIDGLVPTDAYLANGDYRDHLARGGIDAVNFTVASRVDFASATEKVEHFRSLIGKHSDEFTLVRTTDDIRTVSESDTVGGILGFQDTMPVAPRSREEVGDGLEYLRAFAQMGVRIIQLTYNRLNYVGAGACERTDPGLSHFGREMIDEMADTGVVIDLSHCGDKTTMDAIEYSSNPVTITHACPRSVVPMQGRNKTDEQIEALADAGGVIGLTLFPPLVKVDPETYNVLQATIHDVLDHIDYVVDLVGIDHVGFGTDLNDKSLDDEKTPKTSALRHFRPNHPDVYGRGPVERYDTYPEGLSRHTMMENLTRGLVDRGYSDEEIEKILGENFLRVFDEVWRS